MSVVVVVRVVEVSVIVAVVEELVVVVVDNEQKPHVLSHSPLEGQVGQNTSLHESMRSAQTGIKSSY